MASPNTDQEQNTVSEITMQTFFRLASTEGSRGRTYSLDVQNYRFLVQTFPSSGNGLAEADMPAHERQDSSPQYTAPSPGLFSPTVSSNGMADPFDVLAQQQDDAIGQLPRQRSNSSPHSRRTNNALTLMLERSLQHHQQRSVPNSETQRKAEEAAKAIIRIGDGLEKEYEDAKLQAVISESQIADGEILARFKKIINDLRPNLSWKMVVKLFRLGLRLFQTVTGNDHHRQQLELLMALLGFFRRELSSWIKEQGGWDVILEGTPLEERDRELQRNSMPNLEVTFPPLHPTTLETLQSCDESVAAEETEESCDESTVPTHQEGPPAAACPQPSEPINISTPRQRPRSLSLAAPNSCPPRRRRPFQPPDHSSSPFSSSSLSLAYFGLGATFGFALCSYLFGK